MCVAEIKTLNPFNCLPEDKLNIIRDDFYKRDICQEKSFEQYLKDLHEEDELIPEEVLDFIESKNSTGEVFTSADELLKDLHKDDPAPESQK